ncbi:Hypothetical predicted protein [Mytilus galloprovincialis]|uniref:Macro domain-containing protein n=1 Tax=Mytilus galloprovincialis TaxID=29158 RepID=A0A8B6HPW6_MYTGA|nr:Hypothetical predicted protein [Mytilus galloprovincialis]
MAGKGQPFTPPVAKIGLPDTAMQGIATNRAHSGKKHAPGVPAVQKGQKGNDGKEERLTKAGIEFRRKKFECLAKTGFFAKDIPKSVQVEILNEVIQLKGPDPTAVKLAKDRIKQGFQDIKSKSINITNNQTKILTMNHALNFIDHSLNIPKMCVSWEVVTVADQDKLIVFSFHEKEAKEMSGKIMACIAEETVSPNDSELPWFKDFYEKEQSRIITESAKNGKIKVYMTTDLRKTYFDVKRPPKSPQNKAAGGSPLLNEASGVQMDPTRNQQTGAGTSDNHQSPRNKDTNKHGKEIEVEECGKAKESTPNSKKDKQSFEDKVDLNNQQIAYLDIHLSDKLLSICKKVEHTMISKQIVLRGKQKHVDSVKKEIVALLESISIVSEQVYCGKVTIPKNFMDDTVQPFAKVKKCEVKVIKCKKPVLQSGLVICTESPKMQVLCLKGPLYLADVDAMLCPVTEQLEPIGKSAIFVNAGLDNSSKQNFLKKPGAKCNAGDMIPLYETGNLDCSCVYLSVQDQTNKGVVSEPALQKLAQRIIDHLQKNGYQSLGLDLDYDDKPAWRTFSFSLVSHLWRCSAGLRFPILMCCYAENDELFENLDDYLVNTVQIDKSLNPVLLTHLEGKASTESVIKIVVEKGSIIDYDNKVDIIVNSVGASLKLQNGYVSKQLVGKGGPSIQQECDKDHKKGIDIGDLAVTNAGKLKCKKIFHVALYTRWIASGNLSIKILKSIIIRCLKEAEIRMLSSIAFPALGTGTLGYPPCLVAKTMFEAVYDFKKSKSLEYLRDVYFVLYEDKDLELFRDVDQWMKTGEKVDLDLPPKHVLYLEEDLETRIVVSDRDYYRRLHFKELRIVFSEKDDSDKDRQKLEWDVKLGTYTTAVKAQWTDDGIQDSFKSIIKLIKDNRFHVVDIILPSKALEVPLERQLYILIDELKKHSSKIDKINNKNKGKNVLPEINYISIVRVFVPAEEYSGFEKECTDQYGNVVLGLKPFLKNVCFFERRMFMC